jgi:hypothetical protein
MLRVLFSWQFWTGAFVVYLLLFRPVTAANLVHKGQHMVSHGFDSLGTFANRL